MRGFKATYNMKCIGLTYEVGKIYSIDKLEICKHGFHFCQKMEDVINYYKPFNNFVLLEVEALGKIETDGDKSVTDKMKILRIVPKEEYNFKTYQYEYDSFGNMIKEISPSRYVYQYEYDDFGNRIKKIHPLGDVYQYEYDEFGNMIKLINPSGDVWQYEYDAFGNMIKEIYPSGNVWQVTIQ